MLVCPKCGKKSTDIDFIDAFCVECYPVNVKEPKAITVDVCKHCKKMFLAGEWMPLSSNKISRHVESKAKGDFSEVKYDFARQELMFTIRKGDAQVKVRRKCYAKIQYVTCRHCSRLSGGYFEAIVQLRGDEKRVEKYRKIFERGVEGKTFIAKEKPLKSGGVDMLIGSRRVVLSIVQGLGLRAKITRKLVGTIRGRKAYRTTFAIRLE